MPERMQDRMGCEGVVKERMEQIERKERMERMEQMERMGRMALICYIQI
jgi:hypothetical protein